MSSGAPLQQPVRAHRTAWLALALTSALLGACTERPDFTPGGDCELNTDCATSLVCRLGRCRVECRAQRDCAVGLECVRDARGLGACQLEEETMCERASDCEAPLVCHFGRCTNECETDRDCPPGASCAEDETGASGCRDPSVSECELTSDCEAMGLSGKVCAVDDRCREPCREDWDCRDGMMCLPGSPTACGWPAIDGGLDGGADAASDAMMSDAGDALTPPPPPRMAASLRNTCAAPAGQPMRCWGDNASGQIGDDSTMPRLVATAVLGITGARSIGVGHGHTCASSGSRLDCWGRNTAGQLGIDSMGPALSLTPVEVTLLPAGTIDDVALGLDHSCAIVEGALYCWGGNGSGQLGLGDNSTRVRPTLVTLPELAVRVDTHSVHTCALLASGAIACFGANGEGQVGSGTGNVLTPALVPGIADAVDVATGSSHTCALRRDGTVWCWGSDAFGQIGRGDSGELRVLVPTPTSPIPAEVVQIAAGSAFACARTRGGALYCWGENNLGQAGRNRFTEPYVYEPAQVVGLDPIDELAAGTAHTCARTASGVHLCFGDNGDGQLGDDSMTTTWTPVEVVGL